MNALTRLPLVSASRPDNPDSALEDDGKRVDWILASAHETGAIVLWEPHGNARITPMVHLHPSTGPCRCCAS